MPLFLTIAFRELRGGMKGFTIALACLFLSSWTLTTSQSFTHSLLAQLEKEGRVILGGDVELRRIHLPFSAAEKQFLASKAEGLAFVSMIRVMAQNKTNNAPVELKAVDSAYPLLGALELRTAAVRGAAQNGDGTGTLAQQLEKRSGAYGALAAPELLSRLALRVGERFTIGETQFQLRALIEKEPDGFADGLSFATKIIVSQEALTATQLVQFGSLVSYRAKVLLPQASAFANSTADDVLPADERFTAALNKALPSAGFQVRNFTDSSPSVRRFIERMSMFLTLAALTTFFVSGIGIANAVGTWFAQRRKTIATLKCLGAPAQVIFNSYLTQILLMASAALLCGAALGVATPFILFPLAADFLPLAVEAVFSWRAVGVALLYGWVITIFFSLIPLALARATAPSHLFRQNIVPLSGSFIGLSFVWWVALALLGGILFLIALALAPERTIAIYFLLAAGLSILALYALGGALIGILRRLPARESPLWRIGLSQLTRPASQSKNTLMALGLGLSLLSAIVLVEGNLSYQIDKGLPDRAPSFFVADIPNDDRKDFVNFLARFPFVADVKMVPLLRVPLSHINGQSLADYQKKAEEDVAWVLRGDRGITYAGAQPKDVKLTEGEWWAPHYDGLPLLSLGDNIAKGLGLKVGDKIGINLFGRPVEATIHNLRKVDWTQGGMNFVFIFSPKPFNQIPVNYFSTFYAPPDKLQEVRAALVKQFPSVVLVETSEALKVISALMEQISFAARIASLWTLLAGILVLAAAQAASFHQKLTESVIFKVLGAPRRFIMKVGLVEVLFLGLGAALVGLGIGTAAASAVIRLLWRVDFIFLPITAFTTLFLALFLVLLCGMGIHYRVLSQKPAPFLRTLATT